MRVVYFALGTAVLVSAIVDLLWTSLWVDGGAGPLSSRLTTTVWRGLRRLDGDRSGLLSLAGPLLLVLTLTMWVGFIWAGWTLIFASSESSLIAAHSNISVTWSGRIYFVAFTMFGMGNGDFYPAMGLWQLLTALTTASGGLFVAMSVSYVLSVLGAVSDKRAFACNVAGIGKDSAEIVRTGWNGEGFDGLESPLESFATELDQLADQHRAYPILHYYHSERSDHASAMAVAVLDEAMTLLRFGVPPGDRPDSVPVETVRSAARHYIRALDGGFEPADETPPPPDIDRLREAGIPTVSDEAFADALDELNERRRKLRGIVDADARDWPPIRDE